MLHRVFPARRIRAGAFAATTALALSLAGCGQNTMTTGSLAPQASTNPQLARNQGILDKWAKAYKRDPENVQLALGYGQALAASGRSMEAAGVYAEALNHNPNHPELLAMYGRTLAREKPGPQAIAVLERARKAGTKDWSAYSALGASYDAVGRHKEAQDAYKQALALKPNEPAVLSNMGLSQALAGQHQGCGIHPETRQQHAGGRASGTPEPGAGLRHAGQVQGSRGGTCQGHRRGAGARERALHAPDDVAEQLLGRHQGRRQFTRLTAPAPLHERGRCRKGTSQPPRAGRLHRGAGFLRSPCRSPLPRAKAAAGSTGGAKHGGVF